MDNYTRLKDVPLYENPPVAKGDLGGFTFPSSDLSSWISKIVPVCDNQHAQLHTRGQGTKYLHGLAEAQKA
jgi:hypothetical protein